MFLLISSVQVTLLISAVLADAAMIPFRDPSSYSTSINLADSPTATEINLPHTIITPAPKVIPTPSIGTAFTISTVAAGSSGQDKNVGDIVILLPEDLAQRVQEIISREQCWTLKKRNVNDALCGAEGIILNAQPDGALSDLLLIQGLDNRFNIQWASASLNEACEEAVQFAQNMADILQLDSTIAASLGVLAFALASRQLFDNIDIQAQNIVPTSEITH